MEQRKIGEKELDENLKKRTRTVSLESIKFKLFYDLHKKIDYPLCGNRKKVENFPMFFEAIQLNKTTNFIDLIGKYLPEKEKYNEKTR